MRVPSFETVVSISPSLRRMRRHLLRPRSRENSSVHFLARLPDPPRARAAPGSERRWEPESRKQVGKDEGINLCKLPILDTEDVERQCAVLGLARPLQIPGDGWLAVRPGGCRPQMAEIGVEAVGHQGYDRRAALVPAFNRRHHHARILA